MKKKSIIKHLHSVYQMDGNLSKKQKDALLDAIKIIEKEKGEIDPAWIDLILQALGLGIGIIQKGP